MISKIMDLRAVPNTEVKRRSYHEDRKNENIDVKKALEHIIRAAKIFNNNISFEYEEEIEKMVVKVTDGETGKMIRQIPQEEIVRLSRNIDKLVGLLIDKEI
jgi:flagellar protein FlaG